MVEDLVDYRATMLVWASLGGASLPLPYLEQEAFGPVEPRARFYGFVNDSEFIAACQAQGIKVMGIVFEAQGWEFPVELNDDETEILALNELRGVGHRDWLGLREFSSNRYPKLWPAFETYFPGGLRNSRGEPVTDLIEECVARDIDQNPCQARWGRCSRARASVVTVWPASGSPSPGSTHDRPSSPRSIWGRSTTATGCAS